MDSYFRIKKTKSFFDANKSLARILRIFPLCLFLVHCQNAAQKNFSTSAGKKDKEVTVNIEQQIEKSKNNELGLQLTQTGSNTEPFLSEDGRKLLFTSGSRKSHVQKQIYLLEFDSMKEKRLTFNDGDNLTPIFVEGLNIIAYSSNTDYLKEHPVLFYPNSKETQSDIYISEIAGTTIERLTTEEGFEGQLQAYPKRGFFIYLSIDNGKKSANLFNSIYKSVTKLYNFPQDTRQIKISPDQKNWLWIEKQNNIEQINFSNNPSKSQQTKTLNLPLEEVQDLNWVNNKSFVISGSLQAAAKKSENKKKYSVLQFDLEKSCWQELLSTDNTVSSPLFDPKKQALIYSVNVSGNSQIFLKQIPAVEIPCNPIEIR